jgi:hypothetical protein
MIEAVACVYDHEKKKPGYKVGAVESLSKRLGTIKTPVRLLK